MELFSPYLVAVAAGWIVAQGAKYIIAGIKDRSFRGLRQLYMSGNMPSAHTATVMALVTVIGIKDGIDSGLFGLAALFASIVMYDAVMVRRSSGEQGIAVQSLIKELKSTIALPRAAKGHQPLEVLAGAVIGVLIGVVVFLATK
ncbi:MAG: divergent PAP2 family protein [Chloroflexi bacterium]|nr:MAG: divergent PAP2 family protein [Chloroflexota bacterium]